MTPGLRAKIFNIIDWLVENEAVCRHHGGWDDYYIDIPADKLDEAVEKIIEIIKRELDRDKDEVN